MHSPPAQQSPFVLHAPSTYAQSEPQTKAEPASAFVGTHARPQQG
jgi:hypothetical protein